MSACESEKNLNRTFFYYSFVNTCIIVAQKIP